MLLVAEDGGGLRMSADARALLMQRLAGESLPAPPPLPGTAGAPAGLTPPQQVRSQCRAKTAFMQVLGSGVATFASAIELRLPAVPARGGSPVQQQASGCESLRTVRQPILRPSRATMFALSRFVRHVLVSHRAHVMRELR